MLILRLYDFQKSANICAFCKYYYFSLRKHWPPEVRSLKCEIDTFSNKQSRSISYRVCCLVVQRYVVKWCGACFSERRERSMLAYWQVSVSDQPLGEIIYVLQLPVFFLREVSQRTEALGDAAACCYYRHAVMPVQLNIELKINGAEWMYETRLKSIFSFFCFVDTL